MNTLGYNALALVLAVGAIVLSAAAIADGRATVEVIAIGSPLLGLATTVMGRGKDDPAVAHNDSAQGH